MNILRLFIAAIFFVTQPTWAAPKPTLEQYLKGVETRLQSSKTYQEFVQGSPEIPSFWKNQIVSWLKANQLTDHNLAQLNVRVTDLIVTDKAGHSARLTYTDLKRGVLHINGHRAAYNTTKTVAENLDYFVQLASQKEVASLFFPRAEAGGIVLGAAVLIAIIALSSGLSWGFVNSPEAIKADIEAAVKSANFSTNLNMDCNAYTNKGTEISDAIEVVLSHLDKSTVQYLISKKHDTYKVVPSASEKPDGLTAEDRDELIELSKSCCNTTGCEKLVNGAASVPAGSSPSVPAGSKRPGVQ